MFLTRSTGVAAVVAALFVAVVSPAAAGDAAASNQIESPLDTGRVDVAAISLDDGVVRLAAGDGREPESLVYTTGPSPDGVDVGWDTGGVDAGEVFGDAVVLRLSAADGPAEPHGAAAVAGR